MPRPPLPLTISHPAQAPAAAFYFDLASPRSYLAAERVLQTLPGPAEWRPVLASALPAARAACDPPAEDADARDAREQIALRARELGLQPLRWPEPFPFDSSQAMRVATYARSIGRTVAFAQAAFRQAFAGGHSLQDPDFVLIAAAACEMHPAAVLQAMRRESIAKELRRTTEEAARTGVRGTPAVTVGGEVFHGERELERAARRMREHASSAGAA